MKNVYFLLLGLALLFAHPNAAQSTGSIYFTFSTGEGYDHFPDIDAVILKKNEVIAGATSEQDGSLFIKHIESGIYAAKLFPEGMEAIRIDSIVVDSNDITHIPVQLMTDKQSNKKEKSEDAIDVVYKFSKSVSPLIQLFK